MVIALVLLSALLHATWNALLRVERDKDRALVAAIAVASLIAGVVSAVRWTFGEPAFPTASSLAWTIGAGLLEWIYFWSLARALELGRLGAVYTISRGGAGLVVWPVSIMAFGEPLAPLPAVGSALVLGGLSLASLASGDTRQARRGALAWAVGCAVAIAGYHLAYKAALRDHGGPSAVFALSLGIASAINGIRIGRPGRAVVRGLLAERPGRIVLMGAICGGAFLILMEALRLGGAGFVLTLRNTSVLFAVGLAFAIGDRPRRPELVGATLVAIGAVLMAWPG